LDLTDKRWKELNGGYRIPYDASVPLTKLEGSDKPEVINEVFNELWNELHHQGNVGVASYLAVPQLARIAIDKDLCDWNLLGVCSTIEQQRHVGDNPSLPIEFLEYYNTGLSNLKEFVIQKLKTKLDRTTFIVALSTIATCNGNYKLGKAILEMEDEEMLDKFLGEF